LEWYKIAAENGHSEAQRNYADALCALGRVREAVKWYRYAAELGEPMAAHSLAVLYKTGAAGITTDYDKSSKWESLAGKLNAESTASLSETFITDTTCENVGEREQQQYFNSTKFFITPQKTLTNQQNTYSGLHTMVYPTKEPTIKSSAYI
jgi:uncharacterized protein